MEAAKKAAAKVLDTLNEHDYVGLVGFDTTISSFEEDGARMYKATKKNVDMMKLWVEDLSPVGGTNFKAAFKMIDGSLAEGHTANCNGAILFLTDGIDESG